MRTSVTLRVEVKEIVKALQFERNEVKRGSKAKQRVVVNQLIKVRVFMQVR